MFQGKYNHGSIHSVSHSQNVLCKALYKIVWSSIIEKAASSSRFQKINVMSVSSGNESLSIFFPTHTHKKGLSMNIISLKVTADIKRVAVQFPV